MTEPRTLTELFLESVKRYGTKRAAVREIVDGKWRDFSHQEMARNVKLTALGLRELGIKSGDRVAILSTNGPKWTAADFGCLMAGCTNVAVYPTLPAEQVKYIVAHSGSSAIFVEDREQYDKIQQYRSELPDLNQIILFSGEGDSPEDLSLSDLMKKGQAAEANYPDYESDALRAEEDDVATLIYTSGTTGNPKGVMLTHRNICSNLIAAVKVIPVGPNDSTLSFLPVCHSFERTVGHYLMFNRGVTISYAENMDTIARDLVDVAPTVLIAVPRVYEKIYARVLDKALSGGALKRRIFHWARRTAESWADFKLKNEPVPAFLAGKKKLADRLVFSKLVARTGGRIQFFVSGAAPLSPEVAKFFFAAGLPIAEGYGLTETSPIVCVNPATAIRIGTVGPPIPGVEVKIAEDGEILVRGPNVMKGYFNDQDATDAAIDAEGWFYTGDIGEIDELGYLKITDRKKDIIVTAGGKNIAPQPIENKIKLNKFILNAVILGDKKKFPLVIVVPNIDAIRTWAAERNMGGLSDPELVEHADTVAKLEREVMLQLRGLAGYETPKKVLVTRADFTIESGELTPTLKVKRRVVEANYASMIATAYSE
jgi:long-chain acyl-CoA synthetase